MMGLRQIADRLSGAPVVDAKPPARPAARPPARPPAPVAAAARALLSFNRDWAKTVNTITEQINDANERREALVDERDALVLAAVEGDDNARRKADSLDVQIDAIDRELSRLSTARHRAAERLEAERAAQAEKAHKQRLKDAAEAAETFRECAIAVDDAVAKLREALADMVEASLQLRELVPEDDLVHLLRKVQHAVPATVCARLGESGYGFPGGTWLPLPVQQRALIGYMPDADEVVAIIERAARRKQAAA